MIRSHAKPALALPALVLLSWAGLPLRAQSSGPKAEKGYAVSVFAQGGQFSAPDSIVVIKDRIFVAYGDGNDPAGKDGKPSEIVEYTYDGQQKFTYYVIGHNDGMKWDPYTQRLWAMQNEDGNPNLVIIDPSTREERLYVFAAPAAAGGGYDDIVFRNGEAYFSASNPTHSPNAYPAIVKAKFVGDTIQVVPIVEGTSAAIDVITGGQVTLNLTDPDSMTLTPNKDILLDSQGDSELILVRRPGTAHQTVFQIPLTSPYGTPQADDTLFTPSDDGFILVADTPANTVYKISKKQFVPGAAYTAAVGGPNGTGVGFVARLDLEFGLLTPVVTGLQSPHGMAFVRTSWGDDDDDWSCHK